MPSKEWLSQHDKVAAYLKPELYELLQVWKKERNIQKDSQALVVILEHYLNEEPPPEISNQFLEERVEQLEKEMGEMKQLLFNVGAKILAPKIEAAKPDFNAPTERMEIEYDETDVEKGLTKTQLCQKIGLNINQANTASEQLGFKSVDEYLFKITGWQAGEGKRPRYFLSDEKDEILSSSAEIESTSTVETKATEAETEATEAETESTSAIETEPTEAEIESTSAVETEPTETNEVKPSDLYY